MKQFIDLATCKFTYHRFIQ